MRPNSGPDPTLDVTMNKLAAVIFATALALLGGVVLFFALFAGASHVPSPNLPELSTGPEAAPTEQQKPAEIFQPASEDPAETTAAAGRTTINVDPGLGLPPPISAATSP